MLVINLKNSNEDNIGLKYIVILKRPQIKQCENKTDKITVNKTI